MIACITADRLAGEAGDGVDLIATDLFEGERVETDRPSPAPPLANPLGAREEYDEEEEFEAEAEDEDEIFEDDEEEEFFEDDEEEDDDDPFLEDLEDEDDDL